MPKWTQQKVDAKVNDLRTRLDAGESITDIAKEWGTTKQNVSQFKKRYLSDNPVFARAAVEGEIRTIPRHKLSESEKHETMIVDAYKLIAARDEVIKELEKQIRDLKLQVYYTRLENKVDVAKAREFLQSNIR